jgi:hypothetical protein
MQDIPIIKEPNLASTVKNSVKETTEVTERRGNDRL